MLTNHNIQEGSDELSSIKDTTRRVVSGPSFTRPEDQYHEAQEREWSLLLAERDPENEVIIVKGRTINHAVSIPEIIHAPDYEDNGSGVNPEW